MRNTAPLTTETKVPLPAQATVELFPVSEKKKTVCLQGCSHCPASIKPEEYKDTRTHFPEHVLAALAHLDLYLRVNKVDMKLYINDVGYLDESKIKALSLLGTPNEVLLNFGTPHEDEVEMASIIAKTGANVLKLIPEMKTVPPKVFGFSVLPVMSEFGRMENNTHIITTIREMLDGSLAGIIPSLERLNIGLDVNTLDPTIFEYMSHDNGVLGLILLERLASESLSRLVAKNDPVLAAKALLTQQEGTNIMRHLIQYDFEDFPRIVFSQRLLKKEKVDSNENPPTENKDISVAFHSTFVWINHSTYNASDLSLRMPYDTFSQTIDACEATGVPLNVALMDYVRQQRASLIKRKKTSIEKTKPLDATLNSR